MPTEIAEHFSRLVLSGPVRPARAAEPQLDQRVAISALSGFAGGAAKIGLLYVD